MTWDDLEPLDVVFPLSDSGPWVVTWKGRDEHGVTCLRSLNLYTGEHSEIEAGISVFAMGVRILRDGEDVNW